ncbi:sporulation membrane protein YtaF [Tepidibacter hydrothermalis]|uniref:Sporulation membrane protein YtaF n=1 Tax=Tepidibacter hydrothermalis TaxID=3036126 RepID=A0ABY8ECL3_9FIRM|nr:sporulation membrane protein YtaF [Tepidibacter hydrothermalis]WFD10652.1 sporulation membrane protein YtaF [Tepidibacter hydrothermalis]
MIKITESFLIAIAICIDAFAIGLSYGMKNIKFPKISLIIISFISVCVLTVSIILGNILETLLPNNLTTILSFLILVGLGCSLIIDGYIKHLYIQKKENNDKNLINIKLSRLEITVNISPDNEVVNKDISENIDFKESLCLGIALSLDSLGVGFGSAIANVNYLEVIIFVFIFNLLSIPLGTTLGKKFKLYVKNIKTFWIAGGILIILGILKLA